MPNASARMITHLPCPGLHKCIALLHRRSHPLCTALRFPLDRGPCPALPSPCCYMAQVSKGERWRYLVVRCLSLTTRSVTRCGRFGFLSPALYDLGSSRRRHVRASQSARRRPPSRARSLPSHPIRLPLSHRWLYSSCGAPQSDRRDRRLFSLRPATKWFCHRCPCRQPAHCGPLAPTPRWLAPSRFPRLQPDPCPGPPNSRCAPKRSAPGSRDHECTALGLVAAKRHLSESLTCRCQATVQRHSSDPTPY